MSRDTLLILEPSSSGVSLISAARKLGVDPVVVTYNQHDRVVPRDHLALAADVIEVDTLDEVAVARAIHDHARDH
ncbi:MAG: hypothetical protein ABIY55_09445, partial [Kofleriaceae bacterium]